MLDPVSWEAAIDLDVGYFSSSSVWPGGLQRPQMAGGAFFLCQIQGWAPKCGCCLVSEEDLAESFKDTQGSLCSSPAQLCRLAVIRRVCSDYLPDSLPRWLWRWDTFAGSFCERIGVNMCLQMTKDRKMGTVRDLMRGHCNAIDKGIWSYGGTHVWRY